MLWRLLLASQACSCCHCLVATQRRVALFAHAFKFVRVCVCSLWHIQNSLQALQEAAAVECGNSHNISPAKPQAKNRRTSCDETGDGIAARASMCSPRLRRLFCSSHCLLGRLIEWRDATAALRCYDESVCVCPCGESHLQQGRLMLKLASTQQQLAAAQQASSVNSKHLVILTCISGACAGCCVRGSRW